MTHVAAQEVTFDGRYQRQRCAWCGAVLIDLDLTNVAVQVEPGEEAKPPGCWPVGALIRVEGVNPKVTAVVGEPGEKVPDDCCMLLDSEVTS